MNPSISPKGHKLDWVTPKNVYKKDFLVNIRVRLLSKLNFNLMSSIVKFTST